MLGRTISRFLVLILIVAAAIGSPAAASVTSASDEAGIMGCATLVRTWKDFITQHWYAEVYNPCGVSKRMRATVPLYPDPDCTWVGAYRSAVFKTWYAQADGAADC